MASSTPSFIYEFALIPTVPQYKQIHKYFNLSRIMYNSCLNEALHRLKLIQNDVLYKQTILLKKGKVKTSNFKYLNDKYGFNKYALQSFAIQCKNNSKFLNSLGTHVIQKLSDRAFDSVQKLAFKKANKVYFQKKYDYTSFEGKNNNTFLIFDKNNFTCYLGLNKNTIPINCKIRKKDKYLTYIMSKRIKYCRLVCRQHNTQVKYYLQLVLEGTPYVKFKLGSNKTGLDIGPSTIAIVNKEKSELKEFCIGLDTKQKELKKLQKQNARRLRLNNQKNYELTKNNKLKVKKNSKDWYKSNKYQKTQKKIQYLQYKVSKTRENIHNKEINEILKKSNQISAEKLSYKAFQKLYGKSINKYAPSKFIKRLEQKLNLLGGTYININTYKTKLSQTCICGNINKKELKERTHKCSVCGLETQRDLLSAYLSINVSEDGLSLDIIKTKNSYKDYKNSINKCIEDLKDLKKKGIKLNKNFGI